jgi:hypothetical protein
MCTLSMIMDDWNKQHPPVLPTTTTWFPISEVSKEDFEALKAEVESLKKLLKAAKIYDEETGQPNCETESKIAAFKELANYLDIDLEDVFPE